MSTVLLIELLLIRKRVIDFEDGFTNAADKHYDTNVSVDQEFVVTLEEQIEPVTPQDPKPVPGIPVTPEDPASWPKKSRI